jgi:hypothetical protein
MLDMKINEEGEEPMDTSTDYRRHMLSLIFSIVAVVGTAIGAAATLVFGVGGNQRQLEQNTRDLEQIHSQERSVATKDDLREAKEEINRRIDDLRGDLHRDGKEKGR